MDHTKPAQWFRMYAEFATDPKVQMLTEADQRRYMMLLCLRCSNGDVTLHDTEVAFQLRINADEWAATKANLVTRKLVTNDNKPTAWEKRQKASDTSAVRVAKHRALRKQASNADVTLQQRPVEKEIEIEKEKKDQKHTSDKSDLFESFWTLWPATDRRTNKAKCAANWKKNRLDAKATEILSHVAALKKTEKWLSGFEPAPMTYLNGRQWEDGLPTVARLVSSNHQPSKQANRDSYAAQAAIAQANLDMGGQQHDEHDITGECARVA